MKILLVAFALFVWLSPPLMAQTCENLSPTPSAQINSPPSEEKLALIRRFMVVAGIQGRIDSGNFLERYAFAPELGWREPTVEGESAANLLDALTDRIETLNSVYEKYRPQYQSAYERHLNWEFTESELRQMIAFFETPVGQHYLDGTWRMEAYTGTDLEETEETLVAEAVRAYRSR
tara:strand:+ start:203 stop:733 length:531 start_codon:yes stop_codon:yes gene_type:complete